KSLSDDEEDLEALRLAALQSLKKKNAELGNDLSHDKPNWYNRPKGHNKRGRFFGGRGAKNQKPRDFPTQFPPYNNGNRARNSNLISIPTLPPEGATNQNATDNKITNHEPQLILPQYRYTGNVKEEKSEDNSKFSRYDKSESEDTEEEEEEESVEEEEEDVLEGELKRADSLEALMQELDDEIQGKSKPKEVKQGVKKKVKKKKKKVSESANETSETEVNKEAIVEVKVEEVEVKVEEETQAKENLKPAEKLSPPRYRRRSRSRSPLNRRNNPRRLNNRPPQNFPPAFRQNLPFVPPQQCNLNFPPPPFFNSNVVLGNPPPLFPYDLPPPLPLLNVDTKQLQSVAMAPLSPRSARFVLENRKIVEKRKRSPRRSYSRSPSPLPSSRGFRRSKSPRRSLSPLYPRRKSLSPRRRSLSPRKSPAHHRKPAQNPPKKEETSPKNKPSVRERLGLKPTAQTADSKKDNKDEVDCKKDDGKVVEEKLDPVLEARKKKFENKEIKVKEGIIRLKPKEEEETAEEVKKIDDDDVFDDLDDILLEDDDVNLDKHIFSDEESNSDNEGRFKAKENTNQKVPVLSFTQLVNGTDAKKVIPDKPLIETRESRYRRDRNRDRKRNVRARRSQTPPNKTARLRERITVDKKEQKPKIEEPRVKKSKSEKKHVSPPLEKRFERKIEIKIKNPSKYEKDIKDSVDFTLKTTKRKVEIEGVSSDDDGENDPQIIVENEDETDLKMEDVEDGRTDAGDLRAQLSKKRAERLHKGAPLEGNTSRLLQNALQGAVFKGKSLKEKETVLNDGKLPIHLRLGLANANDVSSDFSAPAKSSKRKSKKSGGRKRSLEQVYLNFVRFVFSRVAATRNISRYQLT
ncbi:unnamed protein product, partial [Brassicogethes aeneus]